MRQRLVQNEANGVGVSVISCCEIAWLVAGGKFKINHPVAEWFALALDYAGVQLIDLSPEISIEANNLPGTFHKDPADRIIVATARVMGCELLTADRQILDYQHVMHAR